MFVLSVIIGIGLIISYINIASAQKTQHYEKVEQSKVTDKPSATQSGTIAVKNNFSLDNAPSESLRGMVGTISGSIEWQSRTATQPATLDSPQQIQQGESLQTGDNGKAIVEFTQCCSIHLFSDTAIDFIQTLPANVVIAQTKGSAEYLVTNTIPVAIRSLHLLINSTNGDVVFTVSKTLPVISVYVKKGTMQASFNDLNYNSTVIPVTAGETFYFNDTTREEDIE